MKKKKPTFSIRLDSKTRKEIEELAKKDKRSMCSMIELLLLKALSTL